MTTEHRPSRVAKTYEVIVARFPRFPAGEDWIVRVYHGGRHVHSAEGGASLAVGLHEVERAIREDADA